LLQVFRGDGVILVRCVDEAKRADRTRRRRQKSSVAKQSRTEIGAGRPALSIVGGFFPASVAAAQRRGWLG
jgi:hypothetical protein